MNRYFLEVSYLGTRYAGFQVQPNAATIQSELEKAWRVFFRKPVLLTGSSRTDAGVHAIGQVCHVDLPENEYTDIAYRLNRILTLATTKAIALSGIKGEVVTVEVDIADGLPGYSLLGLPDAALSESRESGRSGNPHAAFRGMSCPVQPYCKGHEVESSGQ